MLSELNCPTPASPNEVIFVTSSFTPCIAPVHDEQGVQARLTSGKYANGYTRKRGKEGANDVIEKLDSKK